MIRMGAIAVLAIFLVHRFGQYKYFFVKPLWVVETLIYAVFLLSYATRIDPLDRSRGFRETVVPLIGGVLPFALLLTPPNPWIAGDRSRLQGVFYWMTASTSLTLWGLWTLRRSFSITVEVRDLVTGGLYRWIRHPVYMGEILTAGAVTVWRFSPLNAAIFSVFVFIQILRARWEEAKLARIFPDYRAYSAKAMWIWPAGPNN